MPFPIIHRLLLSACILTLIFLPGCQETSKLFPVKGVIRLDGKAVPGAIVSFVSKTHEGIAGSGTTDGHGVFSLSSPLDNRVGNGLPAGEYFVIVVKKDITNPPKNEKNDAAPPENEEEGEKTPFVPEFVYHVPKKYELPQTSGLSATIKETNEPMVFHLKTDEDEKSEVENETQPNPGDGQ